MSLLSAAAALKTVHLVPHSHDDVGWLKTLDGYYDGTDRETQLTNVRVELSSVIAALKENPQRKFCEVEMRYFSDWYYKQSQPMKDEVKALIANK